MGSGSTKHSRSSVFPCQDELLALIETLVDVIFCAKDLDGRYTDVNSAFVRRTERTSKRDVVGRRAGDLFAAELAARYEAQDAEVLATGEPLLDQLELIRRANGKLGWYLTTKLPVASRDDPARPVGVVSLSRDLAAPTDENIALERLQDVVAYVQERLSSTIRVADLAEVAECSASQLERRMRRVFGVSATQYVLRVRVEAAARLLAESDMPLAEVATLCGFYDQPDLTRHFARVTNWTPAQFRRAR